MKKTSLAGMIAVTLVAVTPVATTTSFAATTEPTVQTAGAIDLSGIFDTVKGIFDKIVGAFSNKGDTDTGTDTDTPAEKTSEQLANDTVNQLKDVTYDENNPVILTKDLLLNNFQKPLNSGTFAKLLSDLKLVDQDQRAVISQGTGNTFTITSGDYSANDMGKLFDSLMNGNGNQIKLTITSTNAAKKVVNTKEITFTNNTKTVAQANNLKIDYKSPINVDLGSKTTDVTLSTSATANTTITNNQGDNVAVKSIDPSSSLYSSAKDARNATDPVSLGNTFTEKDAKYYQPVVIQFNDDLKVSDLASQAMNSSDVVFTVNGNDVKWNMINSDDNTLTYIREVDVVDEPATENPDTDNPGTENPDTDKPGTENPDTENPDTEKPDTDGDTDPADEVGVWKTTDQTGTLTVNDDVALLVDGDNAQTTRALAPSTSWATDQYRVNSKTGAKQYRVSTNEWVNAEDVKFSETKPQMFKDIMQLSGYKTVSLDGPSGFIYMLFNKAGSRTNRTLPGASGWATDQVGIANDGSKYYRVSTDEWVKEGTGVNIN